MSLLAMQRGFEPPCLLNSAQVISSDCRYNHFGTAPYNIYFLSKLQFFKQSDFLFLYLQSIQPRPLPVL